MTETAYLVVEVDSGDSWETKRVYLDRAEADAFVAAYNAVGGHLEVEESTLGAPDVAYDGPIWVGYWRSRRKLVGEKQLVLVSKDGFVTVVPSAVPSGGGYGYVEYFTGPGWRDLAAPKYEEPPVWIDSFEYRQVWHTGANPTTAAVTDRIENFLDVRGTSKEAVEQLLQETALQVKAERGIA